MSKKKCIGLFGTCGESKWRDKFIEKYKQLNIEFFNPNVPDWKPENAVIEAEHLAGDDIILFPVTNETYGFGSLSEIGFAALNAIKSKNRTFVVYIDKDINQNLIDNNSLAAKESLRARALVRSHLTKLNFENLYNVDSLNDMLDISVKLYKTKNS